MASNKHHIITISAIILFIVSFFTLQSEVTTIALDENQEHFTVHIPVKPETFIYKDTITLSSNHPAIKLREWHIETEPTTQYDTTFKETKKIFHQDIIIHGTFIKKSLDLHDSHVYVSYYIGPQKKFVEELLPLTTQQTQEKEKENINQQSTPQNNSQNIQIAPTEEEYEKPITNIASWPSYISKLIEKTESLWIRIILVLLLGLLLSLTPCIYPMIPITVGILHAQGSKSIIYNFFIALSYTTGIATTFAFLGLLAAFAGQMFGALLNNPFFILLLIALLIYVALSLLDVYDLYIPRFLQHNKLQNFGGSLLTAFIFGAMSGTVASPCLSPGLILLLTIVTTLGSKFLGFILLFTFGIGLSIPLLIVGTFSSSLSILPQAGSWMIEIKHLFGFMLFGMCFYFLMTILPWHIVLWLFSGFILCTGIFYLKSARTTQTALLRTIKNMLGMILIAGSLVLFFYSYKATYLKHTDLHERFWQFTDYEIALTKATEQHKKIFVAVSAPSCTLCKLIDKTIFSDHTIRRTLDNFIVVKIDISDTTQQIRDLKEQYNIFGAPTYLLINPETKTLIKRWGSELYDMPKETFIVELKKYI